MVASRMRSAVVHFVRIVAKHRAAAQSDEALSSPIIHVKIMLQSDTANLLD